MGEQVVERRVGEMRDVVQDAERVGGGDEIAAFCREAAVDLVAAGSAGAHRPRKPEDADAAFEPPRQFIAAVDAVGALDEDHDSEPAVAGLVEFLPPSNDPDPAGLFELFVASELPPTGLGRGEAIVAVAVAPGMAFVVETRLDEDRAETEFDRGLGEVGKAAAVRLPKAKAGLEIASEFGEVGQIKVRVDPGGRVDRRGESWLR